MAAGGLTPLFQWSQNLVTAISKPMLKANAPTKMLETKMPGRRGSAPCQRGDMRHTVASDYGVVDGVCELKTWRRAPHTRARRGTLTAIAADLRKSAGVWKSKSDGALIDLIFCRISHGRGGRVSLFSFSTTAMALRMSVLPAVRAVSLSRRALHGTGTISGPTTFSSDLLADMGMDKPRTVTPQHPPRGPIRWMQDENPLAPSKSLSLSKRRERERDLAAALPPKYHFHAHFSSNNTKIYLADNRGRPITQGWWSGGSCGFKGVHRSSHEAGYRCAVRAFERVHQVLEEKGRIRLAVHLKGFGKGRTAVEQIFLTSEGDKVRPLVVEVEDRTPIKIGGTRSKKARRL